MAATIVLMAAGVVLAPAVILAFVGAGILMATLGVCYLGQAMVTHSIQKVLARRPMERDEIEGADPPNLGRRRR